MSLEGYEKKTAQFAFDFYDTDVFTHEDSPNYYIWVEDYYDDQLFNETCVDNIDTYGERYRRYTINYNGEEKYVYQWIEYTSGEDAGYWTARSNVTLLVPEGYDGLIAGFSASDVKDDGLCIWENYEKDKFFLWRLN